MDDARRRLIGAVALLPVASTVRAAHPEDYPDKPVRLVVPFPPGGGADNLARAIMPKVSQVLGKPIVIDNKPGAGGNVGAELVAGSPPDGYTLLYGTNGTHSINQTLYQNLRFDPIKDFAPVSRMTEIAAMLVVNPQLPVPDDDAADPLREGQSGQGELRVRRQRHDVAPGRRTLQDHGRPRHRAHPVPRRRRWP